MDYTKESRQYHNDVSTYLEKVRRGRRVAKVDPLDEKFSQQSDNIRQLRALGAKGLPDIESGRRSPFERLR